MGALFIFSGLVMLTIPGLRWVGVVFIVVGMTKRDREK